MKTDKFLLMYAKANPQLSSKMPSWLNKLLFFVCDVPQNIEVDYSILTLIVLYNPDIFYDINWVINDGISSYLIRLYNWHKLS
jgi:hypothetical protein